MNDTHPQISQKIEQMMKLKTPEERLRMGCSMHEMSRRLVISSILRKNPNISQNLLRREIFLKFYGTDFNFETREKIIRHLVKM